MKIVWNQDLRNKLYALGASIVAVLTTVGIVSGADGDQAKGALDALLENIEGVVGFIGLLGAWHKSRPSKVTVVDVPKTEVQAVLTTSNDLLAGPAAVEETGTVLAENATIFDGPSGEHVDPNGI